VVKLPRWFPLAAAAVLAVVVAAAVAQAASTGDLTAARLAGGLAIVPCAVATGRFADRRAGVAIGVIVAPLVALLTGLTSASAGWFVLVVFTGQAGSTMAFRRGATIYGAALAAILVGAVVQPDQGWVSWGIGTSFGFWGAWAARSRCATRAGSSAASACCIPRRTRAWASPATASSSTSPSPASRT